MEYDSKGRKNQGIKEKIKKKRTIFLEWSFFVGFWVERIAGLADIK